MNQVKLLNAMELNKKYTITDLIRLTGGSEMNIKQAMTKLRKWKQVEIEYGDRVIKNTFLKPVCWYIRTRD